MANSIYHYEWCYLSGRINIQECHLLNTEFFEKLLSGNNLQYILTNLNNTPLRDYFTEITHLYEFETRLDDYYHDKLYKIRSLSPYSAVCDFFLIRNDILNLKKFIKSKISGLIGNTFLRGTISKDTWDDEWHGKATSLPEIFKELITFCKKIITQYNHSQITLPLLQEGTKKGVQSITPLISPLSQGRDKRGEKKEALLFIIDLICDGAYLRYIEKFFYEINVEIIKRYLKMYQLVQGLKIIRRAMILKLDKNLLDQYFLNRFDKEHVFHKLVLSTTWTSEKTLHEAFVGAYCNTPLPGENFVQMLSSNLFPVISFRYEKLADNYLLDLIRPVKFIPFGPERVFGYLCGFTVEVFNLKLVLGGKVHRIEENLLKERLRKTYV
ncbi:MAG: V-type ATPase subunit [Candidatus Brocadia sp.]|jgi:vacuolar-type H+-ATPase subunit C/Vma6